MYYQRTCRDNLDNSNLLNNNIELVNQIGELKSHVSSLSQRIIDLERQKDTTLASHLVTSNSPATLQSHSQTASGPHSLRQSLEKEKLEQIQNKEVKTEPKNVETDIKDVDSVEVELNNNSSNWCSYYNYPSYFNSRECIPEEKYCTYKSYSGVGYKGKNKNPISYYNLILRQYLEPINITTYESSESLYLKYNSSNCCKLIANTCILKENVPFQNCESLVLPYLKKINYILPFCPLYQEDPVIIFPILSDDIELGGEWTLSQPGIEGKNILFTIDSKTGEIVIPEQQPLGSKLTGPKPGKYTVTYTVYGYKTYSGNGYKKYSLEWSQYLLA